MHRAIFVCSGNICRSPMAERLFNAALKKRGLKGMAISMGTLGLQRRRAASNAVEALKEIDIPLEDHRSQGLSAGLLGHGTVVFVMERAHRDAVLRAAPGVGPRAMLLGQFDPDGGDAEIEDPVGQDLDAFRTCRNRLERCIDAWLDAHA